MSKRNKREIQHLVSFPFIASARSSSTGGGIAPDAHYSSLPARCMKRVTFSDSDHFILIRNGSYDSELQKDDDNDSAVSSSSFDDQRAVIQVSASHLFV